MTAQKEKVEFIVTPGRGVVTPGPHSESNTIFKDRDFITHNEESLGYPPPFDSGEDYEIRNFMFDESEDEPTRSRTSAQKRQQETVERVREEAK